MSRVLVIDDSPMLVELTVRALASAGYQATGATDLASLDQKLTEGPFALILMDVNMPEMFGDDVVEYLRTQKRVTSKLVLYSDISEEELAAKTRNSGADGYILKGGGLEAVIAGIMRILGAPTASAAAPARPVAATANPAARPAATAAAPRPPAVAPATRAPAAPAAPRPSVPGTPPVNGAPPPRVASPTQAQAIPGPRAPVAGQVGQPRPVTQPPVAGAQATPVAGAHPGAAAPRAPVAGQVGQPRPVTQPPVAGAQATPVAGAHPGAAAPRAPVAGQVGQPRPVTQPPVAGAHPTTAPRPAAPAHAAPPTAQTPARPVAPAAPPATRSPAAPVQAQAPAAPSAAAAAPTPAATPAPAAPSPAVPAAASGGFPSAAKMAAAAGRKPRILIVDDSEMTARIIEADLVTKGFEVHIADSADKATKIILKKQTRPDLVLLDVRMPNVNGEQFCRFIKSNSLFKGIKVLLCSGENVEELQRICREAGADGYVPKDAVLGHLVAKELNPSVTGNE
jgi:CheY-like chemotaxis protein